MSGIVLTPRFVAVLEKLRAALQKRIDEEPYYILYMCHWLADADEYEAEKIELQRFISSQMRTMSGWVAESGAPVPKSLFNWPENHEIKAFLVPEFSNMIRLCWIERALYLGELR